ncbi:uncharacterized protein KQ657_003059 [Scheffersomyces spartinae]|uniref:Uncharacterized protein n=1 Tax=Scheffersomyces spartinae TaxID=45513 RepID=A0A9P7V551_9ASCO|nr:uncharacterized protein KQ657_003059 [Scheffersomyces spartinae]KAG7191553.1 hypothetical protein KQ657_003059 [Scheffersomyces spartinae]
MRLSILLLCTFTIVRCASVKVNNNNNNYTKQYDPEFGYDYDYDYEQDDLGYEMVLSRSKKNESRDLHEMAVVAALQHSTGMQYEIIPSVVSFTHVKVESLDELEEMLKHKSLDESNVYHLPGLSIFIHRTALNSAAMSSGIDAYFAVAGKSNLKPEKRETRWFHVRASKYKSVLGRSVPVSACFSQEHGEGGTIYNAIQQSFGGSSNFAISTGIIALVGPLEIIGAAWTIGASVNAKGTVTCNVKKGQTGQIALMPYVTKFPDAKYREVETSSGYFEYSKWHSASHISVIDTSRQAVVQCITKPEDLRCDVGFGQFDYNSFL